MIIFYNYDHIWNFYVNIFITNKHAKLSRETLVQFTMVSYKISWDKLRRGTQVRNYEVEGIMKTTMCIWTAIFSWFSKHNLGNLSPRAYWSNYMQIWLPTLPSSLNPLYAVVECKLTLWKFWKHFQKFFIIVKILCTFFDIGMENASGWV